MWHVGSNNPEWGFCGFECDCEESATDRSEVCDAGGDVWCSNDGDASVWLWVFGCVSTVEEGVAHDGVHVRGCEVCFRKHQDVKPVGLHVFDKGVHFGTLPEACGIPTANVQLVFGRNLGVMVGFVGGARL